MKNRLAVVYMIFGIAVFFIGFGVSEGFVNGENKVNEEQEAEEEMKLDFASELKDVKEESITLATYTYENGWFHSSEDVVWKLAEYAGMQVEALKKAVTYEEEENRYYTEFRGEGAADSQFICYTDNGSALLCNPESLEAEEDEELPTEEEIKEQFKDLLETCGIEAAGKIEIYYMDASDDTPKHYCVSIGECYNGYPVIRDSYVEGACDLAAFSLEAAYTSRGIYYITLQDYKVRQENRTITFDTADAIEKGTALIEEICQDTMISADSELWSVRDAKIVYMPMPPRAEDSGKYNELVPGYQFTVDVLDFKYEEVVTTQKRFYYSLDTGVLITGATY